MSMDFIKNATSNKLELQKNWLAQKNDFNIIDVSLCAGQTIISGKDDEGFTHFLEMLDEFIVQLSARFPFITFTKKNILHSTLLTIFNDSEDKFTRNKFELLKLCNSIKKDFRRFCPLTITFKDVVLTSNGSIIILGSSQKLSEFRRDIYRKYDTEEELRKNIIHITLGRLLQDESFDSMNDINTFLQMKGSLSLPPVIINYPKFILSRDLHCSVIDEKLSIEFNYPE
jgi:hypothetical protein